MNTKRSLLIKILLTFLTLTILLTGCNNNQDTFDIEAALKQAARHLNYYELADAYTLANEVLEEDPDNITAYRFIASAFIRLENHKEAQKYINEAEKRIDDQTDPDEIFLIYVTKAETYVGRTMFEGAHHSRSIIDYLEKAIAVEGISSDVENFFKYIYFTLGVQYKFRNNLEKSLYCMQKFLEHDPENKGILYTLATLSFSLKDFEKGMAYFKEYLNYIKTPGHYYYTGYYHYYFEREEYDKAYEYIQEALKLIPDGDHRIITGINSELGRYYETVGDIEKAKEHYKLALEYSLGTLYNYSAQEMIKRLDLEVDDLIEQLEKERELAYSRHPLQYR